MPGLDNLSEIAALLHIEEKTRDQPKLKDIHDAAARALEGHNANHMAIPPEPELPNTAGALTLGAPQEGAKDDAPADPNVPALDRRI
jgi:hypothetical protein